MTTYIGPGGITYRDGVYSDEDGTPLPPLEPGEHWIVIESFRHDFPDAPTFGAVSDGSTRNAGGIGGTVHPQTNKPTNQ